MRYPNSAFFNIIQVRLSTFLVNLLLETLKVISYLYFLFLIHLFISLFKYLLIYFFILWNNGWLNCYTHSNFWFTFIYYTLFTLYFLLLCGLCGWLYYMSRVRTVCMFNMYGQDILQLRIGWYALLCLNHIELYSWTIAKHIILVLKCLTPSNRSHQNYIGDWIHHSQ